MSSGLPPVTNSARTWRSPGRRDLVGQDAAGKPVVDRGKSADARLRLVGEHALLLAETREIENPATDQRAAEPVEVTADGIDRFLDPVGERAVRAHVDAGRAIERRSAGAPVDVDHFAQLGRRNAGDALGPLRRPSRGNALERRVAGHEPSHALVIHAAAFDQHVQKRQKEEDVGVGPNEHVFTGGFGGFGAPRIDEIEPYPRAPRSP